MTGTRQQHLVVVVDDDADIRNTMQEILSDEGHQVACCANGAEALEVLRTRSQDVCVVFLDLMMPVMNGWDFRREQLADPAIASIPVVVVTAARDPNGALGAVSVLKKPISIDGVLKQIAAHC